MEEQKEGQSQVVVEEKQVASPEKQPEVQSKVVEDEVIKYRSLQSRADKESDRAVKLEMENSKLKGELIKKEILFRNPLLEPFLQDIDFSDMTREEADKAAENLVDGLEQYFQKRKTFSQTNQVSTPQQTVEAPDITSSNSVNNTSSDLSEEQFLKLSRKEMKKFLNAKGLI